MRILVFGPIYPDSFARNIIVALGEMGHQVAGVSPWEPPPWLPYYSRLLARTAIQRLWSGDMGSLLLRRMRQFQPDICLNVYSDLEPGVVARLRRQTEAALVAWFPDHLANLRRQYLLAAPYHCLFFKDPYIVRFVCDKLGKKAFHLPECCNPLWHRRVELTPAERGFYGCDLTTAANMYYYRALLLEPFADYNLKIWGRSSPPWLNSSLRRVCQNHFVAELEKAKAFNAAQIVLNTMHYGEIESVNARVFETAGCGAFQISEYRDALARFFEPETEIVTFRTREELKEKVDYYLARPEERRVIADRAHARAYREHTYQHRLRYLLSVVAELHAGRPGRV